MASAAVLAGIGMAGVGFGRRYIVRQLPNLSQKASKAFQGLSQLNAASIANNKYYKGGFEQPMTKREARLILLSLSPATNKSKINEQFKKSMFANHPDRGGSPFIATKIKEAKDVLEK